MPTVSTPSSISPRSSVVPPAVVPSPPPSSSSSPQPTTIIPAASATSMPMINQSREPPIAELLLYAFASMPTVRLNISCFGSGGGPECPLERVAEELHRPAALDRPGQPPRAEAIDEGDQEVGRVPGVDSRPNRPVLDPGAD